MSDRESFLAAIAADPNCDVPRLAFADWLDENGDCDRDRATVEFIRLSCTCTGARIMPRTVYPWIENNWRRLVPRFLAVCESASWFRKGRVIHVHAALLAPIEGWMNRRSAVFLLDFNRGLLARVRVRSAYGCGATFSAFLADQPWAICDCPGLCELAPYLTIAADPEQRSEVESFYRSVRGFRSVTP